MKALQSGIDTKQILTIDAIRYSLLLERQAHTRLRRTLRTIERNKRAQPTEAQTLAALGAAWQIIDSTYRARGLIGQIKGLSHRTDEFQLFTRSTKVVEDLRHFFQHLNSEIPNLTKEADPIMGSLSWTNELADISYTVSVGHWTKGMTSNSAVLDSATARLLPELRFNAGAIEVDLKALNRHCREVGRFIEKWLRSNNMLRPTKTGASMFKFSTRLPTVPNTR